MSEAGIVEKRSYTRFTINAPATIWRENAVVAGQVVDISLGGAFIRLAPALPLFEAITVSLHDATRAAGLVGDLPATVVRANESGFGVRFERTFLDRGVGDYTGPHPVGLR